MELRHLRYFVAVAEAGSVSGAARRLHVSQPPLSRQVHDLEAEIGVVLFKRTAKSLQLTEAGEVFLSEARDTLQRANDAVTFTRAAAHRQNNRIRIGHSAAASIEFLPRVLRGFRRKAPHAKIDLQTMTTVQMIRGLHSGELDVSLTVNGQTDILRGIVVEQLGTYGLRIAVHKGHRFAKLRKVPLSEIAQEPIIALSEAEYPWYNGFVTKLLSPHQPSFKVADEYNSAQSVIAAVEAEQGVAIVYDVMAKTIGSRVVLRPIVPISEGFPLILAYREKMMSPIVEKFLTAARAARFGKRIGDTGVQRPFRDRLR